jgi:hypothetical protein
MIDMGDDREITNMFQFTHDTVTRLRSESG